MADIEGEIEKALKKFQGKRAKVKALKQEPTGTTSKKLPKKIRLALEEALDAEKLVKVNIHTGGNAAEVAKSLRAKAFTIGYDVYFAKTGDARNMKALAREFVHVVRRRRMPIAKRGRALTSK